MRTLIDNATVTAALRAIGVITSPEPDLFDLDVAALRTLIDAIVFSDEIVILDTYKPEYTATRKDLLGREFIKFHSLPTQLDEKFRQNAVAHIHNWELSRRLGSTYAGLLDELSVLFRHAWRRSEGFLVFKALGVENKYNSAVLKGFLGLAEGFSDSNDAIKSATDAKIYNRETHRVIQSLVWVAIRTVYYRQVAKVMGCEYSPHPLRHAFNLQCILFDNHPDARNLKLHSRHQRPLRLMSSPATNIADFVKKLWDTCNEADDNVFGVETFDVTIPPFLGVVIKNAEQQYDGTGRTVLEHAFKLREDPGAKALRKRLSDLWGSAESGPEPNAVRELARELGDLKKRLQVYLGYDRERISLSAKVMSYPLTVPRSMTKPFYPSRPHLAFIRDVILELASVSSMARLLDVLWRLKNNTTT